MPGIRTHVPANPRQLLSLSAPRADALQFIERLFSYTAAMRNAIPVAFIVALIVAGGVLGGIFGPGEFRHSQSNYPGPGGEGQLDRWLSARVH